MKAGLPQNGVIEQALDENHLWILSGLLPRVQATLGGRQETMRRCRGRHAAAIEVALEWKHDTMRKGVLSGGGHQTGLTQRLERVAQLHQPSSQAAARRVANPHVLDQCRRADTTLVQISNRLSMAV